jgi:hypothetical protein
MTRGSHGLAPTGDGGERNPGGDRDEQLRDHDNRDEASDQRAARQVVTRCA